MWRSLWRQWAQQTAAEAFREQVTRLAEEAQASQQPSEDGDHSLTAPVDVGVVFALGAEAGGLEDRLQDKVWIQGVAGRICLGRAGGKRFALAVTGPGANSASVGTEALILGHSPRCIVSAGFAGALHERLSRFDLVIPDRLVNTAGRELRLGLQIDPSTLARGWHVGGLLSLPQLVRDRQERLRLAAAHGVLIADLETFAIAELCRRYHVPMWALKVVTDTVDDDLPPEAAYLMQPRKWTEKLGAITGAIWHRPGSVKDMWRLNELALRSADRLAESLLLLLQSFT